MGPDELNTHPAPGIFGYLIEVKDNLFEAFQRLLRGDSAPKPEKSTNYTPDQIREFSSSNRARWLGFTPGRPALEPAMSSLVRALERVVGQNPGHCQFYPYGVPKGAEGVPPEMPLPEIPCTEPATDDDEDEDSEVVLP